MARKRQSKSRARRRTVARNTKPAVLPRWHERIDRPLEILVCIGLIAAFVGLLVDHLS